MCYNFFYNVIVTKNKVKPAYNRFGVAPFDAVLLIYMV